MSVTKSIIQRTRLAGYTSSLAMDELPKGYGSTILDSSRSLNLGILLKEKALDLKMDDSRPEHDKLKPHEMKGPQRGTIM